jgi:hypothetical protein
MRPRKIAQKFFPNPRMKKMATSGDGALSKNQIPKKGVGGGMRALSAYSTFGVAGGSSGLSAAGRGSSQIRLSSETKSMGLCRRWSFLATTVSPAELLDS